MRKTLLSLLTACSLALCSVAGAEGIYEPAQVDLSRVQVIDGRIVGEIGLPEGASNGALKIDCPMPAKLSDEQSVVPDVEYRKISKQALLDALTQAGQAVDAVNADDFYGDDGMSMSCWYSVETGLNPNVAMSARSKLRKDLSARADAAWLEQAGALLCDTLQALDATPCKALLDLCANTLDDLYPYSLTSSDAMEINREEQLRRWRENAERDGRDPNEKLAYARVCYELLGLPVYSFATWTDKQENEYGAYVVAECALREDGTVAHLSVSSVPKAVGTAKLALPAMTWQTWLQGWIARCYKPLANAQDEPYEDYGFGTGVTYAHYDLVSAITPCWVGAVKNQLEPGWMVELQSRVAKDDSLIVTLTNADALSAFVEGVEQE